jgi:hypothetical protein
MDTDVLKEYIASIFRIEVSQVGKVAGYWEICYGEYKWPNRSMNWTLKNKLPQSLFSY